jgi:hypothetical protein
MSMALHACGEEGEEEEDVGDQSTRRNGWRGVVRLDWAEHIAGREDLVKSSVADADTGLAASLEVAWGVQ